MLLQERISAPDSLLKLFVALDDGLTTSPRQLAPKQLPRDARGGRPHLSAAEVLTRLVWGAWRGLGDKEAKRYDHLRMYPAPDLPALGAYSKGVEATSRYSLELRGLLAARLVANRRPQQPYPLLLQDSTAGAVCKVARARQHRTFRDWAHKSTASSGWG